MRHTDIQLDRHYRVALERRGRGGRRIEGSAIVRVLAVRRLPAYPDSVQYEVVCLKHTGRALKHVTVPVRDVIELAKDPGIEPSSSDTVAR